MNAFYTKKEQEEDLNEEVKPYSLEQKMISIKLKTEEFTKVENDHERSDHPDESKEPNYNYPNCIKIQKAP